MSDLQPKRKRFWDNVCNLFNERLQFVATLLSMLLNVILIIFALLVITAGDLSLAWVEFQKMFFAITGVNLVK